MTKHSYFKVIFDQNIFYLDCRSLSSLTLQPILVHDGTGLSPEIISIVIITIIISVFFSLSLLWLLLLLLPTIKTIIFYTIILSASNKHHRNYHKYANAKVETINFKAYQGIGKCCTNPGLARCRLCEYICRLLDMISFQRASRLPWSSPSLWIITRHPNYPDYPEYPEHLHGQTCENLPGILIILITLIMINKLVNTLQALWLSWLSGISRTSSSWSSLWILSRHPDYPNYPHHDQACEDLPGILINSIILIIFNTYQAFSSSPHCLCKGCHQFPSAEQYCLQIKWLVGIWGLFLNNGLCVKATC